MKEENSKERSIYYFTEELDKIEKNFNNAIWEVSKKINRTEVIYKIHQTEWYMRGLIYHYKKIFDHYQKIAEGISERVLSSVLNEGKPLDIAILFSPEVQYLQFEFISLVSLERSSLDNLRILLSPVFKTPFEQLPKSITDFIKGKTNCPVYQSMMKSPFVNYLIDIRDCMVHYRPFASSDNAIAVKEGINVPPEIQKWPKPLANISFRYSGGTKVVTNIFLPDKIFKRDTNGNKTMPLFTYKKKINILGQSFQFVKFAELFTLGAVKLLEKPGKPVYTYRKN